MAKQDLIKFYGESVIQMIDDLYELPENAMIFNYHEKTIALLPVDEQLMSYLRYADKNDISFTGAISYFSNTLREFRCYQKDEEQKLFLSLPLAEQEELKEEENVPLSGTYEKSNFNIDDFTETLNSIKELCEVASNEELLIKIYEKLVDVEKVLKLAKQTASTKKAEYKQIEELKEHIDTLFEQKPEQTKSEKTKTKDTLINNKNLLIILATLSILNVLILLLQIFIK